MISSSPANPPQMPVVLMGDTIEAIKAKCTALAVDVQGFPEDSSSAPPEKKKRTEPKQYCLCINAIGGCLIVDAGQLSKLLNLQESAVKALLQNPDKLLLRRMLVNRVSPEWTGLAENLKGKFPSIHNVLMGLLKQTYGIAMETPAAPESTRARHFRRLETKTPLPIERAPDGMLYAILKPHKKSPPISSEKGAFKRFYFAANLQTFEVARWAKICPAAKGAFSALQNKANHEREAAIQSRFNHPSIVSLYHSVSYTSKKGIEKIGMMIEQCDEGDLEDEIEKINSEDPKRESPGNQKNLWNILIDACSALAELQAKDIHHRDFKPENIFLKNSDQGLRAKLGDFGFAIAIAEEKNGVEPLGSPLWTAPEYVKGMALITEGKQTLRKASEIPRNGPPQQSRERSRIEEAGMLKLQEGYRLCADMKGDVWALGMMLYAMRGKDLISLITDLPDDDSLTPFAWHQCLRNLTQDRIKSNFPPPIKPLEALNLMMLTVNPAERPSAADCLSRALSLRHACDKFA